MPRVVDSLNLQKKKKEKENKKQKRFKPHPARSVLHLAR